MRFERFMSLRYLRGAEGHSEGRKFLRFVTYMAVGGVALGVAALLLSLSIVRGFSREITEKIIGFGAHVQVESLRDAPLEEAHRLRAQLESIPEVVGISPVVQGFVLFRQSATQIEGVVLWGTDRLPGYLESNLVAGQGSFAKDGAGRSGVIVGEELARSLGLRVGDRVTAFSVGQTSSSDVLDSPGPAPRPRVEQFYVSGIYETSLQDFDEVYVFAALPETRRLLSFGQDEVTRFDVTLRDVAKADSVAAEIGSNLGFPVLARSITEVWRGLFAWVALQQGVIPVVIGAIVLVAAINIIGILLMIVLEKTREIGVLQSMGASSRAIRHVFLWLGIAIGLVGTLIGEGMALALALVQQKFEIIPLPEEAYYMKTAPLALEGSDFLMVALVTLILCAAAAYIPARVASRMNPIESIRFR